MGRMVEYAERIIHDDLTLFDSLSLYPMLPTIILYSYTLRHSWRRSEKCSLLGLEVVPLSFLLLLSDDFLWNSLVLNPFKPGRR